MEGYGRHSNPMGTTAIVDGSQQGPASLILEQVERFNHGKSAFRRGNFRMPSTQQSGNVDLSGTPRADSHQPSPSTHRACSHNFASVNYPSLSNFAPQQVTSWDSDDVPDTPACEHPTGAVRLPNDSHNTPGFNPALSTDFPQYWHQASPGPQSADTPGSHSAHLTVLFQDGSQESPRPQSAYHPGYAGNGFSNPSQPVNEQADAGFPVFWNDIMAYDPALHEPERLLEYPLFTGTNYLPDSTEHFSSSDSGFGNSTYSTLSTQYVSVPKGHMDHQTGLGSAQTSPETRVPVPIGFSHPNNTGLPCLGDGQPGNADYEPSFAAGKESGNGGNGDNNGGESEQNNNDMDDGHHQNNETNQNDQNDEKDENHQMDDVFQELVDDERIRPLTEAAENSFRTFNSAKNEATQELEDCTEEDLTPEQNADTGRKKTITELYKSFKDDDQRKTKEALLQKLEEANRTIIRPTKYAGLEDARQALTRKRIDVDAANDPTIPRTDIEKQTVVAELVKAMESCARAQDNKANLDAWREKCKELPDIVELRCWQILEDQIKVHTEGQLSCFPSLTVQLDFETQKNDEPKPKSGRQFADRLACIFQTLRLWKSLCKAMLDPSRLEKFVHNPAGVEKSSSTNKKTNKKRGDHLKDYRKLKHERAASETPPSVQRPEGVPSLSSTQNGNDYTPVINYNNQISAGLHQTNQQQRLDIAQDSLSPSCHTLSPLPTSFNGPPASTDISKSCAKPKLTSIPKKRRTKASPLPAEPGVPFGIKSPKDMQQAQKGAVGRLRKRQRTQNDNSNDSNASNTTKRPRFTPPSDGTN